MFSEIVKNFKSGELSYDPKKLIQTRYFQDVDHQKKDEPCASKQNKSDKKKQEDKKDVVKEKAVLIVYFILKKFKL